ncbi:hypothetical protein I3843_07G072300 [Carya illinoinensis]|nr:hypothetical protein I3843_07G072300 [Carya illinoinensis]
MELMEDRSGFCPADPEGISDSGTRLGEIEGVFWDVKSKLSGVLQDIAILMKKVDLGLGMAMGRGKVITSASLQPFSEEHFPNMGWKASACAEIRENCGAMSGSRALEPLTEPGLNGPQSPLRAKNTRPHQTQHAGPPTRQPPRSWASSPQPRATPRANSPSRVEPVTRKPFEASAHGSSSSRSRDPGVNHIPPASSPATLPALQTAPTDPGDPAGIVVALFKAGPSLSRSRDPGVNHIPPASSSATLPASQTAPTDPGHPTGTVVALFKATTAVGTPLTASPMEENDITVVPLDFVGPNPAQKKSTGHLEALGLTSEGQSTQDEEHSSAAVSVAPFLEDSSEFTSRVLCTLEEEVEPDPEEEEEREAVLGSGILVPFSDLANEGDVMGNIGDDPSLLCSLPPALPWSDPQTDWVLKKVEDIWHCAGISCVGFEDQLTALFTAIAAEQSHHLRSASKRERELKRFSCSVNYDRESSASSERVTDRVILGDP